MLEVRRIEAPVYRRAILEVSPAILIALCQMTEPTTIRVSADPLPPDATVVGAQYDVARDVWQIAVESETFDPVPHGAIPPTLPPPVFVRMFGG